MNTRIHEWVTRISIHLFIYLFVCLFIPRPVTAAGEFQSDYDVVYAVAPDGKTIVTQKVSLTNRQTNLYPRQYAIVIDSENIQNVIARDNKGIISPSITKKNGKTEIGLIFNEQVVGLGKQLVFTLRFENLEIAKKNGSIWEINIPGIEADPDIASYFTSLQVPPSFGTNAYMSPKPADGYRWNKIQMQRGGISAAYGDKQVFTTDLTYFLKNPNIRTGVTQIALPPDTPYQTVIIKSLTPQPRNVERDADGNWLATYRVLPGEELTVEAKLTVIVSLTAKKISDLSPDQWKIYTNPLQYWQSDPQIQDLAKRYNTPQQIYDYVVSTLSYDYNRVNQQPIRKGALLALHTPKESICMEFTDLFIAIARAAGIPARELVGYAYTTNSILRPLSLISDILHAWPEYYDSTLKTWIPVDPTWGNTTKGVDYFNKLDFNHIVFAIHGTSSTQPYPAGSYKRDGKQGKDVRVSFATDQPIIPPAKLDTTITFPANITAGFPSRGLISIKNLSGVSIEQASIAIQASPVRYSLNIDEPYIPPYSVRSYPIQLDATSYTTRTKGRITVTANGDVTHFYFDITPMYWMLIPIFITLCALCFLIWYITLKKNHAMLPQSIT